MSTILYMAISQDGFIAGPNDETPWSYEEWTEFKNFVISCDVIIVGRRAFEIMEAQDEFVDGPKYYVATHNPLNTTYKAKPIIISGKTDLPKADKIGVIGGGELSGKLAKLGLLDEMILDIEPIKLGSGIKLFGRYDINLKLKLLDSKLTGSNTIQRHYQIIK